MEAKLTHVSFKGLKTIRIFSGSGRPVSLSRSTGSWSVGLPVFGMPGSALPEALAGEEGAGALLALGCGELSLGLLVFPICQAHDFIFP